ncbi:hypothetical protein H5410_022514 [Solanum commersonii]|uniref:Uncharacterized protein n=1 Tax=Solanum commersonii TaxID=4109 RepID=A0A9J5ZEC8_SOLCO|nr:hypothetical protein H5410_022514 [Solanum commersonii]
MTEISSFGNGGSSDFGNVGISGKYCGNSGLDRVGSLGFGISGNNLGLGKAGISGRCGNAVLDRVGSSGFGISGNNLGLGKAGISGKCGNAGLDRVGSSGFGISGNSSLGKVGISGNVAIQAKETQAKLLQEDGARSLDLCSCLLKTK